MIPRRHLDAVTLAVAVALILVGVQRLLGPGAVLRHPRRVEVHRAASFGISPPLASLRDLGAVSPQSDCDEAPAGCGLSPGTPSAPGEYQQTGAPTRPRASVPGASIEQRSRGARAAARLVESFDGLGVGFSGPQGAAAGRNPSDNSLAVGPNHVVQIVNSRLAVFSKKGALFDTTGRVLYGAVATNTIFAGLGGPCENTNNGDAVVRYDQLAERWLYVMPIFRRPAGEPQGPYSMCYAVSIGADPLGPYHRYEFKRSLFPDYPRPAIWPDGYYVPSSTGDNVIQKHACVADRARMLKGEPATEQCVIIDGVNFLNNADIDGHGLPPDGAPNIMMAAGGTQLHHVMEDNVILAWKFHVDWDTPANTGVSGPARIAVAPYHYLCDGQLTNCVPQPDTNRRLDAQGDKIMQRLVYRNVHGHESIVAHHSVNTAAGGGGVRWYEFRLDDRGDPKLYQQGTYAPDSFYRWMGSIDMDRQGNIGIGYSFGGSPHYAGQRFAARMADDPRGILSLHETVLVEGEASQKNTLRWEDYTTTAMDPVDDCTFWYVGDFVKAAAASYSTKIGAFRLPDCRRGAVSGSAFFDLNHNGVRDPGEPGIAGWRIDYSGGRTGTLTTDADGNFSTWLPADAAYAEPAYTVSAKGTARAGWTQTANSTRETTRGALTRVGPGYRVQLRDLDYVTGLDFGQVCLVKNSGGADLRFWTTSAGRIALAAHDSAWRVLVDSTLHLATADGSRFTVRRTGDGANDQLRTWLDNAKPPNVAYATSAQLASTALAILVGRLDANATVHDPALGDWPSISALVTRVDALIAAHSDLSRPGADRTTAESYRALLEKLNTNGATITPSSPARCPQPF